MQSELPRNDSMIDRQYYKGTNEEIVKLNTALRQMTAEMSEDFVKAYEAMLDEKKQLDIEFFHDGLHLTRNGYLQWIVYLQRLYRIWLKEPSRIE